MRDLINPTNNSDIKVTEIFQTYNYDKFKLLEDNRNINLVHVKRLIESFNEKFLLCPIIVNEKFEIIDGQHRYTASKESGTPIYYYIAYGYGIKEVQKLNTNQKNWNKLDYLQMYAAEGLKPYVQFQEFMNDFPDFRISACEKILTGLMGGKTETIEGEKIKSKYFENGRLEIPNIAKSYDFARKICEYKPYYKNYHDAKFIAAVHSIINSKLANHTELLKKVKKCHSIGIPITDNSTTASYRDNLEEIYNYRRRDDKVSFRYL